MKREQVTASLKDIFHHVAPDIDFDQLDLNRPLREQVELDSMDFYTILIQIHQKLGVNVPDGQVRELNNPAALIDYIAAHAT